MLPCLVIWCFIAVAFLYALHYSARGTRKGKLIDKIPGPYAWPIIGNTVEIFMTPLDNFWKLIHKTNNEYYPINRVWGVNQPMVNIYHPDDVEALLTSTNHIEKSPVYNFLHPWLGTGLLTSKGKKWHTRRKILTPAFHFNVLQQFVGIFMEQSEKLAQSLCLEGDEVVPDLVALLHKYTVNSICETAMGLTSDMNDSILDKYRSCVSRMADIVVYRTTRPWAYMNWMFRFFKKFKEQVRVLKVLHGFSTSIINERKRYHEKAGGKYLKGLDSDSNSNRYSFGEEHVEGRRRLAMLDLLISAAKQGADIDDEGIREEVDTFIFEGHDTTAMALCFTLLLLAENKEIQDEARAEVDALFEGRDCSKLNVREIQGLTYLDRCIKEALRLFPSVPFIARSISKDLQLKNYLIPGGTMIHVFILALHRDPNFWPNPEVFNPDRFLPDQVQGRHPFTYVPFSAGPRNCIGQKFAMLELKALVGTFLHNFYLEPIDFSNDVRILPSMIIRPRAPIRIKFIRRSKEN